MIPTIRAPEIPPWKAWIEPIPVAKRMIAIPRAVTIENNNPNKTPLITLIRWAKGFILVAAIVKYANGFK